MAAQPHRKPEEVLGADTLSERAAILVEQDIISGAAGARRAARDRRSGPPLRHRRHAASRRAVTAGFAGIDCRDRPARFPRGRGQPRRSARHHADAYRGGDGGVAARDRQWRRCMGSWNSRRAAPDAPAISNAARASFARARRVRQAAQGDFTPRCWRRAAQRRLLTAHSDLYDQAYRYRRVMMRGFDSGKNFVAAHRGLADKVLARDVAGAQAMLKATRLDPQFVYPDGD